MSKPTPPEKLDELVITLRQQESVLRDLLDRLRKDVAGTAEHWEGNTADTFRSHTGRAHRQAHLDKAADRLREAARLARAAAVQNYTKLHGGEPPTVLIQGGGED